MRCLGSPGGLVLSRLVGNSLGFGFEEWVVGVGVESSGFAVLVVVSERASQAEVAAPPLEARATRRELPLPSVFLRQRTQCRVPFTYAVTLKHRSGLDC